MCWLKIRKNKIGFEICRCLLLVHLGKLWMGGGFVPCVHPSSTLRPFKPSRQVSQTPLALSRCPLMFCVFSCLFVKSYNF